MAVQLHPAGVLLAVLFIAAMVSLFTWMFRLPPILPHRAVTARRTVQALHRILVPVVETVPATRAVELACRLGHDQKAEIVLAHVVEVPLTLSLDAEMPAQEAAGRQALESAAVIAGRHNLPIRSRITTARYAADGILNIAREEDVNVIVMGVGIKRRNVPDQLGRTANEVLRRSPYEVILDKAPIPAQDQSIG